MEITTENSTEKYLVKFEYGANNIITKSNVSINGFKFMTNEFSYNENNRLGAVVTTVEMFGKKFPEKLDWNILTTMCQKYSLQSIMTWSSLHLLEKNSITKTIPS